MLDHQVIDIFSFLSVFDKWKFGMVMAVVVVVVVIIVIIINFIIIIVNRISSNVAIFSFTLTTGSYPL